MRVPDVDRADQLAVQEGDKTTDLVFDEAEAPRLRAVAVDGERCAPQRLNDEIRHHPAVSWPEPRPIGVEDPGDPDVELVRRVPRHRESLGETLCLVVDASRPDGVHVAPVRLDLWVDRRVPVDLARRSENEPRLVSRR